jgi:hypothetical protein
VWPPSQSAQRQNGRPAGSMDTPKDVEAGARAWWIGAGRRARVVALVQRRGGAVAARDAPDPAVVRHAQHIGA